ncbi:MAG: hypothetical protein BM485_13920 [Desulfobulbaceae bacterium DB1]|nr:MAG: hypothetical protein BM485_13920 [Desulfobulbaceae bacterium DB1]
MPPKIRPDTYAVTKRIQMEKIFFVRREKIFDHPSFFYIATPLISPVKNGPACRTPSDTVCL